MSLVPLFTDIIDGSVYWSGDLGKACGYTQFSYVPPGLPGTGVTWLDAGENKTVEGPKPPKDASKWSQIKKSGAIKMTPLSRSRTRTEYFTVGVKFYSASLGWPSCGRGTPDAVLGPKITAVSSWVENFTGASRMPKRYDNPGGTAIPDIAAERNALRSQVVSENLVTYDVLTDLAEAKQTAQLIMSLIQAARSPLKSFLDFKKSLERNRKLNPAQVKKALEEKWMQVRYGLLPLMYSVKDAANLIKERNNVYKTSRGKRQFVYTVGSDPTPPGNDIYYYVKEEVTVTISAVAKSMYSPEQLQLRFLDQLGLNPFVTAWELIPFSFVVDWFANVGEWVLAHTSALNMGASQRLMSESIKEVRVKTYYLYANYTYKFERDYGSDGKVEAGPYKVFVNQPLRRETTETYSRNLFTPADIQLQLDIFLNWKRLVDAWCLSQRPLLKALKSLQ